MYWPRYHIPATKPAVSIAVLLLALTTSVPTFAQKPPITGTAVPAYEPLDQAVLEFAKLIDSQAATVAVSKDGELLYSRGFGWRDARRKQPTKPDTLMRISGVTMSFTSVATKMLVREKKLALNTKVFEFLKITPPPGVQADPRLAQIKVPHLLNHQAGWDANGFDPTFKVRQVEEFLRLRHPAQPLDIVRYGFGQPLQFNPGDRKEVSTFGYCVLGRVIESASGKTYHKFIQEELLDRLEIKDIKFARNALKNRDPREVWYPGADVNVEALDSAAGLIASAPALCKYLDNYWSTGELREPGQTADFTYWGSFPSSTALVRQRPDGYNVAVLFNHSRPQTFKEDNKQLQEMIDQALDSLK